MFLKLLGAIIIITASTRIGFCISGKYEQRVRDLRTLRLYLQILDREIVFLSNSLPGAFISISRNGGSIAKIFKDCGELLSSKQGYCTSEAWTESIERNIKDTSLNSLDKEILLNLGRNLGLYDAQNQSDCIRMISEQLEAQEKNAEAEMIKHAKMYKSLGALGGLAIAIMLF